MRLSTSALHLTRVGTGFVRSGELHQVDDMTFSTSTPDRGDSRAARVFDAQERGIGLVEVGLKDMHGIWPYPKTIGRLTVASVTVNVDNSSFRNPSEAHANTVFLAETVYDTSDRLPLERVVGVILREKCVLEFETFIKSTDGGPHAEAASYAYEGSWGDLQASDVLDHLNTAATIIGSVSSGSRQL